MSISSKRAAEVLCMAVTFNGCGRSTSDELKEAVRAAVAALQEKVEREDPKPLTLDELRQMVGEPVYIVYASAEPCEWVVFDHYGAGCFGTSDNTWWFARGYGKAWEAYRHKPKDVADINVGTK